jgi:hypothetical protein
MPISFCFLSIAVEIKLLVWAKQQFLEQKKQPVSGRFLL